jgi:hypothetical protein
VLQPRLFYSFGIYFGFITQNYFPALHPAIIPLGNLFKEAGRKNEPLGENKESIFESLWQILKKA